MTISRIKVVVLALAVLMVVGATRQIAQAQEKIDLTGAWIFEVMTDQGGGTPAVTLKQEGEKITGHISSMTFGEQDLTGTLKEKALTFEFGAADVGKVVYTGTVESNASIKGTLDIAGAIQGTFTAKRKP